MLGLNNAGQQGTSSSTPIYNYEPNLTSNLPGNKTAVGLTAGQGPTYALLQNGSVSCWVMELQRHRCRSVSFRGIAWIPNGTVPLTIARSLPERDFDNDGTLIFLNYPHRQNKFAQRAIWLVCLQRCTFEIYMNAGSRYPTDASPGSYVASTGQTNQNTCSVGTYQP